MQPHAKHEENDANLRQLLRELLIGHETGREGADDDA